MTSGYRNREPDASQLEHSIRMATDSFFRLSSSIDELRYTIERYNRKMIDKINEMDDEK